MLILEELSDAQAEAVAHLAALVAAADGVPPLNEEATLLLREHRPGTRHMLLGGEDQLVGYAQSDPRYTSAQLFVHPDQRCKGLGSRLLEELAAQTPTPALWAFGDLPAARALAQRHGWGAVRELLVLERPLDSGSPGEAATHQRDFRLTGFDPPTDAEAFLALNAAAFAGHPEQGQFSLEDLQQRMAEPWFDPAGLILAWDADGLAGFHWTKRHSAELGEVYVIATAPRVRGRGLGSVLLAAGLEHLARLGCRRVLLYVDSANTSAVEMYLHGGFGLAKSDVCYAPTQPPHLPQGAPS
ncbi:MAG: mycothiol synthase [Micropruina sp.]